MELERIGPCVMPNGRRIFVSCVFSKIIQIHSASTQERDSGTPTTMSCKSAFRISGRNITRSSAQERDQMLIEKLLSQWLSTMAKEQVGKRAIFRVVERFISSTPILFPGISGSFRLCCER